MTEYLKKLLTKARYRWAAIDPKLKFAGATTVLTKLAIWVIPTLDLAHEVIPGFSVSTLIALAAGAFAGYKKANEATVLRTPHEDGNPVSVPEGETEPATVVPIDNSQPEVPHLEDVKGPTP